MALVFGCGRDKACTAHAPVGRVAQSLDDGGVGQHVGGHVDRRARVLEQSPTSMASRFSCRRVVNLERSPRAAAEPDEEQEESRSGARSRSRSFARGERNAKLVSTPLISPQNLRRLHARRSCSARCDQEFPRCPSAPNRSARTIARRSARSTWRSIDGAEDRPRARGRIIPTPPAWCARRSRATPSASIAPTG